MTTRSRIVVSRLLMSTALMGAVALFGGHGLTNAQYPPGPGPTVDAGVPNGTDSTYTNIALVSDQTERAGIVDANLINPWGIAYGDETPFWVANNGTGTSTVYSGDGTPQPQQTPLVVTLQSPGGADSGAPSRPTGLVYHDGDGYEVASGDNSAPARFLYATEDGTLQGWSSEVSPTEAVVAVDNSSTQAIYKGLALAETDDAQRLYATNFYGGRVEVYDDQWQPVALSPDAFVDPNLPEGYAPFGIHAIDDTIYVTYAEQDSDKADDVAGAGKGYVSAYDTDGTYIARIASQDTLNAPWAVARAPESFGSLAGALLVGNFGDGTISAYAPTSHDFLGQLQDQDGNPIAIDGLWDLKFGNDERAGRSDTLYYTAGVEDEGHGVFGRITAL